MLEAEATISILELQCRHPKIKQDTIYRTTPESIADVFQIAEVILNQNEAAVIMLQPLRSRSYRFRVSIDAEEVPPWGTSFQYRLSMPPAADSAIDIPPIAPHLKRFQGFPNQNWPMNEFFHIHSCNNLTITPSFLSIALPRIGLFAVST